MKRCFFVGHRDAPECVSIKLVKVIEQLITEYGVDEFIVGHYGKFDSQAADAVVKMKGKYRHISLVMLLPYHPAMRPVDLPEGFDASVYPFELESVPKRMAIVRANCYMINQADFVVVYAKYPGSNAMKFLEYAEQRRKRGKLWVKNLAEQDGRALL